MCDETSNDATAFRSQEMLPDKILEFFLSSLSPEEAASQSSKHRAEEFHKRYVKMRDALAS